MDIIIVAHFCYDFSDSDNGRFKYLAHMLAKDNNVEIITSDFYHIEKKSRTKVPDQVFKVTLLHEPRYKKNVSLRRFYSHYVCQTTNLQREVTLFEDPTTISTYKGHALGLHLIDKARLRPLHGSW